MAELGEVIENERDDFGPSKPVGAFRIDEKTFLVFRVIVTGENEYLLEGFAPWPFGAHNLRDIRTGVEVEDLSILTIHGDTLPECEREQGFSIVSANITGDDYTSSSATIRKD